MMWLTILLHPLLPIESTRSNYARIRYVYHFKFQLLLLIELLVLFIYALRFCNDFQSFDACSAQAIAALQCC